MWMKLLWVGLGGMLGAMSRFGVSEAMNQSLGPRFPWGTFTVNLLGSFVIGVVFVLAREQIAINAQAKLLIMTGFLGAFTTFSSYALDNYSLIKAQETQLMFVNVVVQNLLGLLFVGCGIWLTEWLSEAPHA